MPETPDLSARLARHRAFWRREETNRPLYGFWQGGYSPLRGLQGVIAEGHLEPEQLTPDVLWSLQEAWGQRHLSGLGDLLPAAMPFVGVPWVEATLGCPVYASLESGCMWAEPFSDVLPAPEALEEWASAPDNPWLAKLLESVALLGARLGGALPFGTPIMRGPIDLLASMVGGTAMVYGLSEEPGKVRRLLSVLASTWIRVAKLQLAAEPSFHGGYGCYRALWAPGELVTMQEDSSALLSPALYRAFVLPEDQRIYAAFDHVLMHNHSAGLQITIDGVLDSPAVAGYELTLDPPPAPSVRQLLPVMRRVRERKPLIIMGTLGEADLRLILANLEPAGLAIYCEVESREQAAHYAAVIEGSA